MKKAMLIAAVLVAVASSIAAAQTRGLTGQDFRDLPLIARLSYTRGFVDGLQLGARFPTETAKINACSRNMTGGQIEAIISKFVNEHPEEWNEPLAGLSFVALRQACRAK